MQPLAGHRVLHTTGLRHRALPRLVASLGAELIEWSPASESVAGASFLFDDLGLPGLDDAGWDRARLEREHPGLVHVSVTPFGSTGPRARWLGGEFVAAATGGVLRLTGYPDQPPVKEALDACTFHADMVAAAGAMAAHYARGAAGPGQHVDVSIQEVVFNRNVGGIVSWQFDQRLLARIGTALNYGRATVRCIWRLADGWCFHSLMSGRFGAPANQALSDWIDTTDLPNPLREVDWLKYDRASLDPAVRAVWEAAIAAFFATRGKAEISGEGRRRGINACVVAEPADVLADPHLAARGFWQTEGALRVPGRFARCVEGPPAAVPARRSGTRPGPLSGVRVLDFSWALVGSITTKTLGDLGADVVKVESRLRPCLSRIDVQVAASRPGEFDDKPWFAHLNTSKRSLALDLKHPDALELLEPLLRWADVVVENFSPGTMAKLGLDYESIRERNPSIIMVSGSVYGQTGPLATEWGVDGTGAALSGRTFLTGRPERDPVTPGAVPYGDVVVPFVMAAFAAAALQHRQQTGRGAHIDVAMYEVCVQQMRDAILAAQSGVRPQRTGNDDLAYLWQDVLPARGEDRWIAVSIRDAIALDRLHALAGDADLDAWTARREEGELVEILQAAGIEAGAVADCRDLIERDAQLAARGALVTLPHPHLGPFGHVRTPLTFSRDVCAPYRAPGIGEHGLEIAKEIAGLGAERVAALAAKGVMR